ncbi:MAG: succinyl-diaminopimelate desuccinylase, partial [Beijerinckiaceae bacterium]
CPSVTPAEGGALAYLEGLLKTAGFDTHRPVFREEGTPDVDNLYARIGNANGPVLVFAGHTDVVPPGKTEVWPHPPVAAEVKDGRLYGRGAEDMKGGVAAAVAAVLAHIKAHGAPKSGGIAFLITGDEEGPAVNGTVKLLAWAKARGERMDHCILGEPTNVDALGDMLKIGRRGSLTGHITVHGKQGHVAYPERAVNPVHGLTRLIAGLLATPLDAGTAHFAPTNLEMTTFDVGNPTTNVIPNEAKASFNIRFNETWTPATLEAEIRRRLDGAAGEGVCYTATFAPTNAVAFVTEPGPFVEMAAKAIEAETGRRPKLSTTGGTSDARFIKDYCPVIEFGLVGRTMHQIDENVGIDELEGLTRIYGRILREYFEG